MDPITISRLSLIRQQEIIEQVQGKHGGDWQWLPSTRERLGNWLVQVGERMRAAAAPQEHGCPEMVTENC